MINPKKVIAIVPAYNEEKNIFNVIKKIKKYCPVVVVDDCSKDNTSKLAKKAGAFVISHEHNKGYGGALITGINYALKKRYSQIITLDGDGQHNPDDIPKFILSLNFGCDIVSGSRFLHSRINCSRRRKIAIKLLTIFTYLLTDLSLSDVQSGFRAYNSKVFKKVKLEDKSMGFSVELPIKAKKLGFSFMEIPIEIKYFYNIKTFWSAFKQGINVFKSIIKYSIK